MTAGQALIDSITAIDRAIEGAVALANGSTEAIEDVGRHLAEVIDLQGPASGAPTRTRT